MFDLAGACQRKAFVAPQLVYLGSVKALTRGGGSGFPNDGMSGMGMGMMNIGMSMSDPRAKENVVEVGRDPRGFGIYLFDYRPAFKAAHGSSRQFGVMADEIERIMPEAVIVSGDGYRRVDYRRVGVFPAGIA